MDPSNRKGATIMKAIIIFSGILAIIIYTGCEKDLGLKSTLPLNDTVELVNFETRYNYENKLSLRMDSVLGDSRCPSNVICVWEGNAEVRFLFTVDSIQTYFVLNTQGFIPFNTDTVINGYEIRLLKLSPYPEDPGEILQVEYHSEVILNAITASQ
jgi:hypothetical protein